MKRNFVRQLALRSGAQPSSHSVAQENAGSNVWGPCAGAGGPELLAGRFVFDSNLKPRPVDCHTVVGKLLDKPWLHARNVLTRVVTHMRNKTVTRERLGSLVGASKNGRV